MLEESRNYLSELQNNNLLYEDILVEDYVQKIFSTIVPRNLHTSLPEIKGISILKSPAPDIYMLPGGALMITTGLLSVLDSEEELVAMMASELSHYVLDHHMINIRNKAGKMQRAEIWSAILSGFAIAADEYLAYKHEYYLPGTFSLSADIISVGIFNTINKHLGMDFSLDQKKKGDRLAKGVLQHNNMNPLAINSALTKIHNYYLERKDFYPLSKAGQHYQLDQRIEKTAEEIKFYDLDYKWNVAGVNVYNAITQLYSKDYPAARYFINKNIECNFAIDEDYIILAKTNMGLYNSKEANKESLRLIEEAIRMAGTPNLNAYKQRIIALMRMDEKGEIMKAINEYADLLKVYEKQGYTVNEADWILSEFNWIEKLRTRYF